jgi:hypothetical protein
MTWKRNGKCNPDSLYFIRSSAKELTGDIMWEIYNTVREIESTFRCLKTDLLDICPVFHLFFLHLQNQVTFIYSNLRHFLNSEDLFII